MAGYITTVGETVHGDIFSWVQLYAVLGFSVHNSRVPYDFLEETSYTFGKKVSFSSILTILQDVCRSNCLYMLPINVG